jgi:hypothetical protein
VFRRAQRILAWACDGDDRIECHGITGEGLGVVTLNLTIVNRDQWACRQLAQDILNLVTWGLKNEATRAELQSRRQKPHQRRGYGAGGRTKTWRESKSPATDQ